MRNLVRLFVVVIIAQALRARGQEVWTNQTPDISAALYGNGLFVAAGEVIKTSPDGRNWTTLQEGPFAVIRTGAFGNNRFLLSTGSLLGWSTNGTRWDYSTDFQASSISFAKNAFWAVGRPSGDTGVTGIFASTDGSQWKAVFRPSVPVTSLASANGDLIAVSSTNETARLFVSGDGLAWNEIAPLQKHVVSLGSAHGIYLVLVQSLSTGERHVESSVNLTNWSVMNFPTTNSLSSMGYAGGQFRASFGGEIFSSPDAVNWTVEAKFDVESLGRAISRPEGLYLFGTRGWIVFSPVVGQWEVISPVGSYYPETLLAVAYQAPNFYAAGTTGIVSSVDGVRWTASLTNAGPITAFGAMDTNLFAFGPGAGFQLRDGAWTPLGASSRFLPYAIATSSNRFVAAAPHAMFTSSDGSDWAMTFTNANVNLTYAAFGNGHFVGLGTNPQNPAGVVSSDGVNWTPINVGTANVTFTGVAFGNGIFLAAQDVHDTNMIPAIYADLFSSTDGVNWTRVTGAAPQPAGRIVFANGLFFLLAADSIAFSADGVSWELNQANYEDRSTKVLSSIAYGALRYVGVGGMVVTSARPVSLDFIGAVDLGLSVGPGGVNGLTIEQSTDLVNWGPVHAAGGDISAGYDIKTVRSVQRYFRAKENP